MKRLFCILGLFYCLNGLAYSNKIVGDTSVFSLSSRDVEIQYLLELNWYSENSNSKQSFPLSEEVLKNETSNALLEVVVFEEAKSFAVVSLGANELQSQIELIKQNLQKSPNVAYWNSLEVSEAELKEIAEKKLRAKKFIQFKRRSSDVAVSDIEAQKYYDDNKARLGKLSFEVLKERIKLSLRSEQSDARLKEWFEGLRRKYKVRNNLL